MSALSVKPSHKPQTALLGPPCVYLCGQVDSEIAPSLHTHTHHSVHPAVPPSLRSSSFVACSASSGGVFCSTADASCCALHAYLCPIAVHSKRLSAVWQQYVLRLDLVCHTVDRSDSQSADGTDEDFKNILRVFGTWVRAIFARFVFIPKNMHLYFLFILPSTSG